ncbi:uncharacterized protein C8R40DRAFT_255328 [Lentinula edodes]|uniref:uncharacterized protein n=1 Tax=Lentinula edodes TaxID=5353 RepID=UPI001E8E4BFF|nr:uncharacterized protein C8R40DRAFT_255328 [Lentinula edodes]KAH7880462.1 hypothetical protein C8R40DRAFT_255328 [Lentinula edodes]
MLKRQRAPSPPPSSSSNVPLIFDSTPVENARSTKRRRTQPPVLDGQMRGWGTPQDVLYETSDREEDDGEENLVDDDQLYSAPDISGGANPNSPYKSANGFLHELHTLQRHRLSMLIILIFTLLEKVYLIQSALLLQDTLRVSRVITKKRIDY